MRITILDCYLDEPTCLGVPPYISPYPRYIAGAALSAGAEVEYFTIDQIRKDRKILEHIGQSDIVVIVAGCTVPGKYMGGSPASAEEVIDIALSLEKPEKVLAGPGAKFGFGPEGGKAAVAIRKELFDLICAGDEEIVISKLVGEGKADGSERRKDAGEIREFAIKGSRIVKQHPNFPDYIIAEIETYRGCPRTITGGCSFCTEPLKGLPDFRPVKDIIDEVAALYEQGIRAFRLGNQPCLFSYQAFGVGELEYPRPNPEAVEKLYSGIRAVAPELKVLHLDNVNVGTVAHYPEESREIAKTIVKYNTEGDVAAFGVESVDPKVVKENNLKVSKEECIAAIRTIASVGSFRDGRGLPKLLPGLNFVFGLKGESRETFSLDYELLEEILQLKLPVRRINVRQVMVFPGTRMAETGEKLVRKHRSLFKSFKLRVRENIDRPMLKMVAPAGTVIRRAYAEIFDKHVTYCRQLGTYPLLVGVPDALELGRFYDLAVVGHGFRSLTALPYPLNVNKAPRKLLELLPGVGRKTLVNILAKRPFRSREEFFSVFEDAQTARNLLENFLEI